MSDREQFELEKQLLLEKKRRELEERLGLVNTPKEEEKQEVAKTSEIAKSLPILFSTKIEICFTVILSPIPSSFHRLHEQLYLHFLEVYQGTAV